MVPSTCDATYGTLHDPLQENVARPSSIFIEVVVCLLVIDSLPPLMLHRVLRSLQGVGFLR